MVRRKHGRRNGGEKRPTATLDLQADEVGGEDSKQQKMQPEKENSDSDATAKSHSGDGGVDVHKDMTHEKDKSPRTSIGSLLVAALFGGVAALGGAFALANYLPTGKPNSLAPLHARIGELETKLNSLREGDAGKDIARKVEALEAQFSETGKLDKAVTERLQGVEKTISDLALAAKGGDAELASIAAIAQRVNGIEARLNSEIDTLKGPYRETLKSEAELAAKSAAQNETSGKIDGIQAKIDRINDRLQSFETKYFGLENRVQDKVNLVDRDIKLLRSEGMTQQRFETVLLPLKNELDTVSEKLALLSKREEEAHENARRSALALAFANLKRALDRGEPFASELRSVRSLSGSDVDFAKLDALSDSGVPTEKALLQRFPSLAVTALQKGRESDNGSSWDKLINKARTTFKYRKTGDVKGDSSEAILARMEHKFKSGETEAALEEFKLLPAAEAGIVGPWTEKLKLRLMIETEMHRLEDQLLQSLKPRG